MKKLIIAAAITLAAIVSQAAAVTWTLNNIQSSPDVTVGAGWVVQIYAAGTDYTYDAAKAGTITAINTTASVAAGTIFKASGSVGEYAGGSSVSIFAVIYDADTIAGAKNYIVSADLTKSVNSAGSPLSMGFGNMAGTTTANMFYGKSWTAVPEPTSGLLLLLGMAGLALKRKRA